ncbi:13307_t:CDS:1, partial [Entrophospora sp. SA101]
RELEQVLNKYDKTSTYGSLSLVILKETADVKWVCKQCKLHAKSKDYIL